MTRKSLRDRNTAAYAHDVVDVPPAAPTPAESPAPAAETPAATAPAVRKPPAAPRKQAAAPRRQPVAAPGGETDRLGIYLSPAEFTNAKAGYLADWSNGGTADTFARWIAAALDTHADRSPQERAERGRLRVRAGERTGSTRSFSIPSTTMQRMRAAITADQQAGRWPSDSAWCGEAIALAVDAAREANGGTLPTPPDRLPNRLVR